MEEHKVLTGMLLVALVVSVVGTVVTVDRLGSLNGVSAGAFTGAASGTGDLNISQDLTISLTDSAIEFGAGNVDVGSDFALLDSDAGTVTDGDWAAATDLITVRNDGNIGVNVTVESNRIAGNGTTSFICQGDVGGCGGSAYSPNAMAYNFTSDDNEAGSCINHADGTSFAVADTEYAFCDCLKSGDNNDQVDLGLIVGVPDDASGDKEATITFSSSIGDVSC